MNLNQECAKSQVRQRMRNERVRPFQITVISPATLPHLDRILKGLGLDSLISREKLTNQSVYLKKKKSKQDSLLIEGSKHHVVGKDGENSGHVFLISEKKNQEDII